MTFIAEPLRLLLFKQIDGSLIQIPLVCLTGKKKIALAFKVSICNFLLASNLHFTK